MAALRVLLILALAYLAFFILQYLVHLFFLFCEFLGQFFSMLSALTKALFSSSMALVKSLLKKIGHGANEFGKRRSIDRSKKLTERNLDIIATHWSDLKENDNVEKKLGLVLQKLLEEKVGQD
jgi:hypothetical protein